MEDVHAFPNTVSAGMTLRDWFAGQALQGLLAGSETFDYDTQWHARKAYQFADAMLAQRSVAKTAK